MHISWCFTPFLRKETIYVSSSLFPSMTDPSQMVVLVVGDTLKGKSCSSDKEEFALTEANSFP